MKLLYKPIGLLIGVLAGLIATRLFEKVWTVVTGDPETPDATDPRSSWTQIATAAVLQGAIFAGVRAVADRAGAKGYQKATGSWPG
ncbi:MAG TPA: DUF4235 domain-containing protein [Jatrophihabitans sp.]|nr:DUF4235 domain-containing protein [Jatrophihabitans sp.]